jgi:diguanylate cyclase (GGDEF)-like protein
MPASAPRPRRLFDIAVLPDLPPMAQWHLLEAAFANLRAPGLAAFLPAAAGLVGYVVLGRVWYLGWALATLAGIVVAKRVAGAFDLRSSGVPAASWARTAAATAWGQAACAGVGGFGAALDSNPATCLIVVWPLYNAMAQSCAAAPLARIARGQVVLLATPLVAVCLLSGTPLFSVIGGLFVLHALASLALADGAVARAETLATAESRRAEMPISGAISLPPAAESFQKLLGRDQTTGLPNRHSFMHLLGQESLRAFRAETHLSVLLVAWDGFDAFEATHPQHVVDEALSQISKRLRTRLRRPADILASLGGGRFGVVLAFTDAFGAATVARNLQEALGTPELGEESGADLPRVPLSIGAATYCGKGLLPDGQLFEFAEEALANARKAGGNSIRRYDPTSTTLRPPPYATVPARDAGARPAAGPRFDAGAGQRADAGTARQGAASFDQPAAQAAGAVRAPVAATVLAQPHNSAAPE